LTRGFKLSPLSSPYGDLDLNYNLTTQTRQALFNKGLLHPSEMLLIIYHFTVVVKSFYKEPSTWIPQTTLSVFYYNLTTLLYQALFNKGLFIPLSFPYSVF